MLEFIRYTYIYNIGDINICTMKLTNELGEYHYVLQT